MLNELEVLEKADHPNITRVFELLEDNRHYFVIMELCSGGNLLEKVIERQRITEKIAADIILQILLALNYMHSQKMMHRDLKPENMLVQDYQDSDRINIKLTDFGFATVFKKGEKLDLALGSPLYMAPELCEEKEYDNRVDVWSTGVIAFILLSGMPPFLGSSKDEIYDTIISSKHDF
jgi:calcium-dependent protein kinase